MKDKTLSDIGELQLIKKIKSYCNATESPELVYGIGDDCAAFEPSANMRQIVTTDAMVEGVHFKTNYFDPHSLGIKSLATSLSDIAAMGGVPKYALISLTLPGSYPDNFVTRYYEGLIETAKLHNVAIIGGNITKSLSGFSSHITVIGETKKPLPLRENAQEGDDIFVTGTLGDSAAGLEILSKNDPPEEAWLSHLIKRHKTPTPRVLTGIKLVQKGIVNAMIDISDGLITDLQRICEMSDLGATLKEEKIPLSDALLKHSKNSRKKALPYALYGGEDYELLFTVSNKKKRVLCKSMQDFGVNITHIGKITDGNSVSFVRSDGLPQKIETKRFDHFSK